MTQRSVADLREDHVPWDVPGHRLVARPLLDGPLLLPALVRESTAVGIGRENAYRVVRRLRSAGVLQPPEHDPGEAVRLAPGEDRRLSEALESADQRPASGVAAHEPAPHATRREAGQIASGDVLLDVQVDRDVLDSFAEALERIARATPLLWGAVAHGRETDYVLVFKDHAGDAVAVAAQLESVGARCRRAQLSHPLDRTNLIAHARAVRAAARTTGN